MISNPRRSGFNFESASSCWCLWITTNPYLSIVVFSRQQSRYFLHSSSRNIYCLQPHRGYLFIAKRPYDFIAPEELPVDVCESLQTNIYPWWFSPDNNQDIFTQLEAFLGNSYGVVRIVFYVFYKKKRLSPKVGTASFFILFVQTPIREGFV